MDKRIKAILERDGSFDGIFYYGVKSTGIVCKPSCAARIPLLKNVELFSTLDEALNKGYRKCKICMKQ